eukprot:6183957-Pleurochrysis_carterae.AAC.4
MKPLAVARGRAVSSALSGPAPLCNLRLSVLRLHKATELSLSYNASTSEESGAGVKGRCTAPAWRARPRPRSLPSPRDCRDVSDQISSSHFAETIYAANLSPKFLLVVAFPVRLQPVSRAHEYVLYSALARGHPILRDRILLCYAGRPHMRPRPFTPRTLPACEVVLLRCSAMTLAPAAANASRGLRMRFFASQRSSSAPRAAAMVTPFRRYCSDGSQQRAKAARAPGTTTGGADVTAGQTRISAAARRGVDFSAAKLDLGSGRMPPAQLPPYISASHLRGNGRSVYIETYGCQMNVSDTEVIVATTMVDLLTCA